MRILADEHFPRCAVELLRAAGHDVLWARTDFPGQADSFLLGVAQDQRRVVVTQDLDFGELAVRWGLPAGCGVVLMRIAPRSAEDIGDRLLQAIALHGDFGGVFVVVGERGVRLRPLR